ncbi:hypothetical protein BAE44_0026119 [Dichanthelium oligosanthes]|uniref:WRKY domain-containing protein n=1 Tax=Dichanthelium oligosanthes TaxID=888268 RepID=A0A1E5UIZ9_9POAL|nr:hypothetical protein BAE44_0026119 [Dichanthelium oligosanthes]
MGDVLHPQAGAGDVALWPGELDEQLIAELLSDDSLLLGALHQQQVLPGGGDSSEHCTRDKADAPAPCDSGGGGGAAAEQEEVLPRPEAVSRALSSVYTGPTIRDIEKALSTSRPYPSWSSRRYSPMHLGRFGAASRAPESKYTTKVRSCGGKTPSDGYKWRKYGQKSIKNNPHPRSYYKCTGSRCGAKKHVEKSTDDPEMLIVTYEGPHLHGPQPLFPRRQWAFVDLSGAGAAAAAKTKQARTPSPAASSAAARASDDGGGGRPANDQEMAYCDAEAAAVLPGNGRAEDAVAHRHLSLAATADSCDDGSTASVPAPRAATVVLACDSPPTTWSCPDFPFAWSPEALLLL